MKHVLYQMFVISGDLVTAFVAFLFLAEGWYYMKFKLKRLPK